ncbi:MAG: transcription antitermination protein NusB [Bacteroidales bacterium]|nr:transcription antitermination protein NusB [Bacteroidales bacterium]
MVNRVLIRIKVVQMLYSYLLTRSEFKINDAPESASRDKRYAYSVYINLLLFLLELSGYSVKSGEKAPRLSVNRILSANKVAKALSINDAIRSVILRGNSRVDVLDPVLQKVHDKIVASAVFNDYSKKKVRELADDVALWTTVMETIIAKDQDILQLLRQNTEFTHQGFNQGVKALTETLRSYVDSRQLLTKAKSDLVTSLDKAYELYLSLFALILDLTDEQERRLENAKAKHLATSADLNPNTRFIDNRLVDYLANHEQLAQLMKEYKVERNKQSTPLLRELLDQILGSDLYKAYLEQENHTLQTDAEFWRDVMRTIILPSDALAEELEDKSVFWNDDLQIMGTFLLKSLRHIATSNPEHPITLLPKFKDLEDEKFGPELFMLAVKNQDQYREYIEMFIERSNWDPERLAYMDIVILTTAIAELINYPAIPVPVTVNEYVDIANGYSTEKSGSFINGILDSVIKYLNEQGIIHKK